MQNDNSKITFYTQRQQLAARVLLTVWLLFSGLGSTLAALGGQSDRVPSTVTSPQGPYLITQRPPKGEDSDSDRTVVDIPRNPKVNPELLSILHKVIEVEEIDQNVRSAAVEVLARLDPRSLPVLLKGTKDKVGHVWTMVTELLLDFTVIELASLPHLLPVPEDLGKDARTEAIKALPGLMTHPAFLAACGQAAKEHPNENVRQTMDQAAQHLANSNSTVLRVLFQAVENSDEDISQAAIEAIEKLDEIDPTSLSPLLEAVKSEDKRVCKAAKCALKKLYVEEETLPLLFDAVKTEDKRVLDAMLEACKNLYFDTTSLKILCQATQDSDWNVRNIAVKSLGNLKHLGLDSALLTLILQALFKAMEADDSTIYCAAKEAFEQFKITDPDILLPFINSDSHWRVLMVIFEALGKLEVQSSASLQALHKVIGHQHKNVRYEVVTVLGNLEAIDATSLKYLCWLVINDKEWPIRLVTIESLGKFSAQLEGAKREKVLTTVQKVATDDENKYVRQAAVKVLGELQGLTPDQKSSISLALQKASEASDKWVRKIAVESLGKLFPQFSIKEERDKILTTVQKVATDDEDEDVRWAAIEVLGKLQGLTSDQKSSILSALQKASEDSYKGVRERAVKSFGKLFPQFSIKEERNKILTNLNEAATKDDNNFVRQAAVEVLGKLKA